MYSFVLLYDTFLSLTSLLCVFCYFPQASGAIYQSTYTSSTCSGTPNYTYKLASTTCVAGNNGRQSTGFYAPASGLPTNGYTYTITSYSTSCSSSPYYIAAALSSTCVASSCTLFSSGGSSGGTTISCITGSSSGSSGGSGYTIVSSPGSVTTGYGASVVYYAASDTQCTGQLFTSAQGYVLGVCVAPSGSTTANMFTSDVRCVYLYFSDVSLCR